MSEKKNSIGTIVFGWCCLIGFFIGGVWVGDYRAEKKTEEQITQASSDRDWETTPTKYNSSDTVLFF